MKDGCVNNQWLQLENRAPKVILSMGTVGRREVERKYSEGRSGFETIYVWKYH